MSEPFDLDAPDHFTAGAVGPPGQRVFYLQAREDATLVTLKCEKEHVRALADYLAGLLERLAITAEPAGSDPGLLEPLRPAWDVGAIGVGYDEAGRRIVIEIHEAVREAEEEAGEEEAGEEGAEPGEPVEAPEATTPEGAIARVRLTHAQAAAFVARARTVVQGGRPICPMCQGPIDPGGHACPRSNGHVTRTG